MAFEIQESQKFKTQAPKKGQMLLYTRTQVIFEPYNDLAEVADIFNQNEVLELHLFDYEREYRLVKTRSKRVENGYIEAVIIKDDNIDTYEEIVNVDNHQKMKVINMIHYGDTGMISIDNYRLAMEV